MNIPIIGDIITGISNGFKSWNDGRVKIKEAKINAEVARWEAQGELAKMVQTQEGSWDMEALRQSQYSWKDEWFTILLSLPFIGSFVPQLQGYVLEGFNILNKTPEWYRWSFLGAVCASFGLRWWFTRKGA